MLSPTSPQHERTPIQPAHWGFWGTMLWGVVISIAFVVLQAITMAVAVLARSGFSSEEEFAKRVSAAVEDGSVLSLCTFVTTVLCCALIVVIVKLKKGARLKEYLCIRPVSVRVFLKWTLVLVGFIIASDVLTSVLGRPIVPPFGSATYATAKPVWMIWVAMLVAAPLFEEAFFRGFLFRGLESSFMGPVGAVVLTAAPWAIVHLQYDAYGIATTFCIGLLFGAARAYTGSMLVPLGLHTLSNLVSTSQAALWG